MLLKKLTLAALISAMALGAGHGAKADEDDWGHGPYISFGYAAPYYAPPPPPPVYYAPPAAYYAPYQGWRGDDERHWRHEDDDDD